MDQSLQNLIDALRAIEASPQIPKVEYLHTVMADGSVFESEDEFDGVVAGSSNALVEAAIVCAEDALITSKGSGVRYEAFDDLLRVGMWKVFPGEQDSFGWLTGCIRTKKGILVFG